MRRPIGSARNAPSDPGHHWLAKPMLGRHQISPSTKTGRGSSYYSHIAGREQFACLAGPGSAKISLGSGIS